jgi:3-phenylpropionate/trans-cinnamate dioxygenase ferredoxin reductase component
VIVGAGHAGSATAIQLRQLGFEGSITLVGAERELPYERPPLSKDYLAGTKTFADLLVRGSDFWIERDIEVVTGERILALDPHRRRATSASGRTFDYSDLVWAAGGRPRPLPCAPAGICGVHSVRDRADVDALRSELAAGQRWVIVGGGYIGLEVAAVLAGLAIDVTIVEAADRLLARVSAAALSRFLEAEHRAHGVAIRLNETVLALESANGRVAGVRLASGEVLPADGVVVGIGIVPNAEPVFEAGASRGGGLAVDAAGRTDLPHVWAAGDVAQTNNRFGPDHPVRVESVDNAASGASAIARALTGQAPAVAAPPWFWSNQYDLKLQTVGLTHGADEVIVRGDPASRKFSLVYRRSGRVIALDCINNVRDYVGGRKLIESELAFDRGQLANADVPLKSLLEP